MALLQLAGHVDTAQARAGPSGDGSNFGAMLQGLLTPAASEADALVASPEAGSARNGALFNALWPKVSTGADGAPAVRSSPMLSALLSVRAFRDGFGQVSTLEANGAPNPSFKSMAVRFLERLAAILGLSDIQTSPADMGFPVEPSPGVSLEGGLIALLDRVVDALEKLRGGMESENAVELVDRIIAGLTEMRAELAPAFFDVPVPPQVAPALPDSGGPAIPVAQPPVFEGNPEGNGWFPAESSAWSPQVFPQVFAGGFPAANTAWPGGMPAPLEAVPDGMAPAAGTVTTTGFVDELAADLDKLAALVARHLAGSRDNASGRSLLEPNIEPGSDFAGMSDVPNARGLLPSMIAEAVAVDTMVETPVTETAQQAGVIPEARLLERTLDREGTPLAVDPIVSEGADAAAQPDGTSIDGPAERGVIDRVIRAVTLAARRGGGRVQLQLHPPQLGRVRMLVTVRAGVVSTRIVAETEAARTVLLNNMGTLRQSLEGQGLDLSRVEVTVAHDSAMPERFGRNGRGAHRQGRRSGRRFSLDATDETARRPSVGVGGMKLVDLMA